MSLVLYRQFRSCVRVVGAEEEASDEKEQVEDRFVARQHLKNTLQGFTGKFWDNEDREYRCIKGASKVLIQSGVSFDGSPIGEDFYGERDLLKRLSRMPDCHSAICRYITDWECDHQSYYAMEFCPNGSLLDFANKQLHRHPRLVPSPRVQSWLNRCRDRILPNEFTYRRLSVVASVLSQIVDALSWLHSKSIAHLDLSLENIMMANRHIFLPKIKLIDFGVAVQFPQSPPQPDSLQRVVWPYNQCVGKSQYMALEVRENSHDHVRKRGFRIWYDAKGADIATLGSILYMMTVGKYPPHNMREWSYAGHLLGYLRQLGIASSFTEDAFDLLSRLWTHESNRITMDELLKHPFIQRGMKAYIEAAQPPKPPQPVKDSRMKPDVCHSCTSKTVMNHGSMVEENDSDFVSTENDPLDDDDDLTHRPTACDLEGVMNEHSSGPSTRNANGTVDRHQSLPTLKRQTTDHHDTPSEYPEEGMRLIE